MPKIKDEEIKNLSMPKRDFYSALKKVSHKKSKPLQSEIKKS
jgi:hypothetical protein